MKYVAFFRNLNLGRPNCPGKTQLEEAFVRAGADFASSFLTNGTVIFTVPASTTTAAVLASAQRTLHLQCGLGEPAYLRGLEHLKHLVALEPFASIQRSEVHECCVSFLPPTRNTLPGIPAESRRRDVEVLRITGTEVLSVSHKIGNTPGSPNVFLEKILDEAVTTRAWNTVVRLVQRHG